MSDAATWIGKLDDARNFLVVYDVLLDIKTEQELSRPDQVSIWLLQRSIRFPELENLGSDEQELRLKAIQFLQMWKVITHFNLREDVHPLECRIAILADEAPVREAVSGMDAEYKRRYGTEEDPAVHRQEGEKVFIGHGRSEAWRALKDYITENLGLEWDEFNRESTAGQFTPERLNEMLGAAAFAFLVMTADDKHPDGTKHARENVIHEAGLFQGKLGFKHAIILLEDGWSDFSNIHGLTYIRFPKGNISAAFHEVCGVLKREGII